MLLNLEKTVAEKKGKSSRFWLRSNENVNDPCKCFQISYFNTDPTASNSFGQFILFQAAKCILINSRLFWFPFPSIYARGLFQINYVFPICVRYGFLLLPLFSCLFCCLCFVNRAAMFALATFYTKQKAFMWYKVRKEN